MNSQTQTPPLLTRTKTPTSTKTMSSSLRDKLRKQGRYHGTLTPSPNTATPSTTSAAQSISGALTPVLDRSRLPQTRTNLTVKMKRKLSATEQDDEGETETNSDVEDKTKYKRRSVQNKRVDCTINNNDDRDLDVIYIREQIEERKEKLRKLKLVKVYRTKNDLNALETTIGNWREVCIEALNELRNKSSLEPKPSIGQLLDHLQIDDVLVRYNREEDSFY